MFKSNKLPISYYRKLYFSLCRDIQKKINKINWTKDQIHEKNKEIAKIKTTKDLVTEELWKSFLKTLTTYWKL
tara:strand:- start:18068 stop:18286 length:219 start_codon:yes stop_codon:yes gene_type:complete